MSGEWTGRIVKAMSGFYYVKRDGDGVVYACRAKGIFRKRGHAPLVGDRCAFVVTHEGDKEGNVERIAPRSSVLARPTVANVDRALVVFALKDPDPNVRLLDRVLVSMEQAGISCVLCLNKADLVEDECLREWQERYEAAGYPVIGLSVKTGSGMEAVRSALAGHLSTVVGPSGAGKSSLVNRLTGREAMEVGAVSDRIGRGKQTTRHIELVEIGEASYLVDTPGFSSLPELRMEKEALADCFPEFRKAQPCRYHHCSHLYEPEDDCGVKQALKAGAIAPERYESYRAFYEELASERRY